MRGDVYKRQEHEPTMTERRIDAMMILRRAKPRSFWVSDENRRTIESLEPTTYAESAYYERWVLAMKSLLLEKGILTEAELDEKVSEVRSRKQLAKI